MSTSDSQLLAAASSVSQNLMDECFHVKMSEKAKVATARLTVVGISLIAMIMARNPDSSVFSIVSFAWAGFGAAFGPAMFVFDWSSYKERKGNALALRAEEGRDKLR